MRDQQNASTLDNALQYGFGNMNGRRDAQYNRRNGFMGDNSTVNLGTMNNS